MVLQAEVEVDVTIHGRLFRVLVLDHAVLERVAARVVDLERASLACEELRFGSRQECVDAVGREFGAVALGGAGEKADRHSRRGGARGEGAVLVGDREAPFTKRSQVDGSLGRCGSLDFPRRTANRRRWLAGV